MGRPIYQPVDENNKENALYGQIIMNMFNGHISTNNNGIIVSSTKETENKFEDINQIYYNLIEQDKVLTKVEKDYSYFIKYDLDPIYIEVMDKVSKVKTCYSTYNYLSINYNNIKSFINDLDISLTSLISSTNSQYENITTDKNIALNILKDMETMENYILDESNTINNLRDLINIEISKEYPGI